VAVSIILVVDDEPVITKTLVLILNSLRGEFYAIGSTNLAEALTIVKGVHPDLVLLDVIMPGARGLEHALHMRDKSNCKVLIMSGEGATATYLDDSNRLGHEPFDIVAKPVHPNDLIAKIREILQQPPLPSTWIGSVSFNIH
jgi:DNA-binding response OmpR family regulator